MITIKKIMNPDIYSLSPDVTIRDASRVMKEKNIGCIFIEKGRDLIGVVTESDIVRRGVAENLNMDTTSMKDIMSSPPIIIDANKSVVEANEIMDKNRIRHLAVKEGNSIVGVVSARDMLHPFYLDGEGW